MADVEKAFSLLAEMEQRPTLFDLPRLVKAVRGVLQRHEPNPAWSDPSGMTAQDCLGCDGEDWPCPTVRAVCEALEGNDAE